MTSDDEREVRALLERLRQERDAELPDEAASDTSLPQPQ